MLNQHLLTNNSLEVESLLKSLRENNFDSKTSPSIFKNQISHSFYFSLRKQLMKLNKALKQEARPTSNSQARPIKSRPGNLVSVDSFGSCWMARAGGKLFQLGTRNKRINFQLPYRVGKNPKPFFSKRDFILVFTEDYDFEIWEARRKRRLFRMKLGDGAPGIKPTEVHIDTENFKLRVNYGDFYKILDIDILTKRSRTLDMTGIRSGGQLYCRATFLPCPDGGIIFAENDVNNSQKTVFNYHPSQLMKSLSTRPLKDKICDMEVDGGDIGTLLWLDIEAGKFVQIMDTSARIFFFKPDGSSKRGVFELGESFENIPREELKMLKYVIESLN